MDKPRTLAIDVGDRRIGIAVTDPLGLTAQPLFTLQRSIGKNKIAREDLKAVARFARQHRVTTVIVGLPLHENGSHGPQAQKAEAFASALREYLGDAPLVELVDERFTTRAAHELLDDSGFRAKLGDKAQRLGREEIIDQLSAMLLLEAWMAHKAGPALLPDPDA